MPHIHFHIHDDFIESQHPRNKGGQFTSKGGEEEDPIKNVGKQVKVTKPIQVYRVVPNDVSGSQAFKPQNGKGVFVFTKISDAKEFKGSGGGKILSDILKPHTQLMIGDFDRVGAQI